MSTYGDIRFRLAKLVPGIDLDLWDGWIADRYQEILNRLPWQRAATNFSLQTVAEVNAGTVTLAAGSPAVVGLGTAWVPAMSGAMFRVAAQTEFFKFTYLTATTGTLDRGYDGLAVGAGLAYRVNQPLLTLPRGLRQVDSIRLLADDFLLARVTETYLDSLSPNQIEYGNPRLYAPTNDSTDVPALMQIRVHPVPTLAQGLLLHGVADPPFAVTDTTVPLASWINEAVLIAGCKADAMAHKGDQAGAQAAQARFAELLASNLRAENNRVGPVRVALQDRFTQHRIERVLRSTRRNQLP